MNAAFLDYCKCEVCMKEYQIMDDNCRNIKILALSVWLVLMTVMSAYHKSEFGRIVFTIISALALYGFVLHFAFTSTKLRKYMTVQN